VATINLSFHAAARRPDPGRSHKLNKGHSRTLAQFGAGRDRAPRYRRTQPMPGDLPFSPTVIATTGERFSGFAPYAASVNDAGMVAFQATLRAGGSGVFTGSGGAVVEVAGPGLLAGVTSHPEASRTSHRTRYRSMPPARWPFA
jgi:hypothetical protein